MKEKERSCVVMDKKTKNILMDMAAQVVVLPITAFVTAKNLKDNFNSSDAGKKVKAYAKQTGEELGKAVKKATDTDAIKKAKAKYEEFSSKAGDTIKGYTDGATDKINEFVSSAEEKYQEYKEQEAEPADTSDDNPGDISG